MKNLTFEQLNVVNGGAWTAEHGIAGGLSGGLSGAGAAAVYVGLASNPAGWVALGIIGAGAGIGALYYMATK